MNKNLPPSRTIKTTETVFEIIEKLQEFDGATTGDLADVMDMAQSTIHDHLITLELLGYVVKEGSEFKLSLKFLDHGTYVRHRQPNTAVIQSSLDQIAQDTGEVAWFIVQEHDKAVYLEKALGSHAVLPGDRIGKRRYLHCPAAGKTILAQWPIQDVRDYADRTGLPAETDQSTTDIEVLLATLDEIRERGYALNDQEVVKGVRGVAVPILQGEHTIGAVGIGAPVNRLKEKQFVETVPELLMGYANEIELRLKYHA